MSLKERNTITPQMKDYDAIGDTWVPYLMRFDSANRQFRSVATDEWGFRKTTAVDGREINLHSARNSMCGANVILGSSAVFGVGATSNSQTIASHLNRLGDSEWLNYGGRALNSTQELILLQLFLPRKLSKILVCSGINNLTLAGLSEHCSPVYNSFFYQTMFERGMAAPTVEHIGVRQSLKLLRSALTRRLAGGPHEAPAETIETRYQAMISCLSRDLRCLSLLAIGAQAQVFFALQPFATWLGKELSAEERRIFGILDSLSHDWGVLAEQLGAFRARYADDVRRLCEELNIPFMDMNAVEAFRSNEWLFVDRIHLTDKGYALVAEHMKRGFSL